MSKYNYDYAAEMIKIAESQGHQDQMEKLAFSRDGQVVASEVEEEMKKLAKEECKCEECEDDCDCECHEDAETKKEASADVSLEETAGLLLEISNELEDAGHERLAAASIALADVMIKEAADKKKSKGKSSGSSSSKSKSSDKSKSSGGKKMSLKERMEKMRAMQGKGKKSKKEDKSDKKSK
jgi:hypothetical protein